MANEIELGTGTLQYGDFIFPNAIKSKVSARPFQDSTRRFTKYVMYRLEAETLLYPGVDVDYHDPENLGDGKPFFPGNAPDADGLTTIDGMDGVRKVLSTRGLQLRFFNKGYGQFDINTTQRDVLNGPVPEILAWEPIGDNFAVRIVWGVEVTLAECGDLRINVGRLTEMSYSVEWGIDLAGLTTRTLAGFYEITLDIRGGTVRNNADIKREIELKSQVPIGFGRVSQRYTMNARRDRMDFTIVDKEYPADDKNRLHRGIVEMKVTQDTVSADSVLSETWNHTIRGRITVAKGQPRHLAWTAFLHVLSSRLDRSQEEGSFTSGGKTGDPAGYPTASTTSKKIVVLGRLSIGEDIYERTMRFSFSWLSFSPLENIFNAAGIWQKIPGATDTSQITSLTQPGGAWTPRGQKQLAWRGGEPIVSLCASNATTFNTEFGQKKITTPEYSIFKTKRPSAEDSWLCFEFSVTEEEHTNRYASVPANGELRAKDASFTLAGVTSNRTAVNASGSSGGAVTTIATIHQSAGQSSTLTFVGKASRLGHAIPKIHLIKYAGADVTPKNDGTHVDLGSMDLGGQLLYRATWIREYTFSGKLQPDKNVITDPDPQSANTHCGSEFFR